MNVNQKIVQFEMIERFLETGESFRVHRNSVELFEIALQIEGVNSFSVNACIENPDILVYWINQPKHVIERLQSKFELILFGG